MNELGQLLGSIRQGLRSFSKVLVPLWWQFFDWVALVSWKKLIVVWLLLTIFLGPIDLEQPIFLLFVFSAIIKVLAGGKRRADIVARDASERAKLERLERHVMEARMQAMQAQIEPHFLFNTLSSIDVLIELDPQRASRMQKRLIQYLRAALPQMRDGAAASTLGQQVALSQAYLEIMQMRMEERLTVHIDVPEVLASQPFPSMMLQTLVENAIQHGLEPKAAGGLLEITASLQGPERLQVSVLDTGAGFSPSPRAGIGLANIRDRLKMLYGLDAELVLEANMPAGTRASIILPISAQLPAAA